MVYSCTVITSRCNEPLQQLEDSPDQCTTPTSSSKRLTAVRSPTGETPSAKRSKEGNAIDEENATGNSSTWSFIIETKGVTTKTQALCSFRKSYSRHGSN